MELLHDPNIIPVEVCVGAQKGVMIVCAPADAIDVSNAARAVLGRRVRVSTADGVSVVQVERVNLRDGEKIVDRTIRHRIEY